MGKKADEAGNKFLEIANKAAGRTKAEKVGLVVTDPDSAGAKRTKLESAFDSCIKDAEQRHAMEAKEQAVRVKKEFLKSVKIAFVEEVP